MVDLSGSKSGVQHSFDNSVFIIPAVILGLIFAAVVYKFVNMHKQKQKLEDEKKRKREAKKKN